MNTPFRLDDHPRRPQPLLAPPPDHYFEQLPRRVMARVQPAARPVPAWGWLMALPRPMRTALASAVVLGGFAASFLLSPAAPPAADPVAAALSQVPETALIDYLAANHSLEAADLASLPLPEDDGMAYFLDVSPQAVEAEVGPALEDTYF
ncbi:hypothetical protein [Hymenobacter weizhouensis]|uniref:hypothetical protein n=1 Tax=Hymenobacter sp. YIM 151500-1 TaxID=2987689 RepID=UPI00222757DA|nr:hypothetical protein [Hymenobacter sp. YIM 151500-1]UYZ63742.1 hypothetical protein OIS53_02605 [Hymenobacter sp. YIM 151500-1]